MFNNMKNQDTIQKLRIDSGIVDKEIFIPYQENEDVKRAFKKFDEALKTGNELNIDDCVTEISTKVCEFSYTKGFHDGMRFILNTMAGKEVIEL